MCVIIIANMTLVGEINIPKIGPVGSLTDLDRKADVILDQIKNQLN